MSKGPERIPSGGSKAGPECGNCAVCPRARGGCPLVSAMARLGGLTSGPTRTITSTEELFASNGGLRYGNFDFRSTGGAAIPSERFAASKKSCSECSKNPCQCEAKKAA